ncbi:MAG: hypothetical protein H6738_14105 [Alphaproteobacteria bacterium]|nr:hypothetical protein [Alphaproteobacteria bacterium]MCB9697910.1 hypothetical protein [Alphaproteobacteria bacterium]
MRAWLRYSLLLSCSVGCAGTDDDVAAAMESGLRTGHLALVAALVADESLIHAHETPDLELRHGPVACCPCKTRQGDPAGEFTLRLDYHDQGCTPDSGLLPTTLAGFAVTFCDPERVVTRLDGGELGARAEPMAGSLRGSVDNAATVDVGGTFDIGERRFRVDLALQNQGEIGIDGVVTVDGVRVALDGLTLPWDRIAAPCPTPVAGTITVADPEDDVVIDLADPGLGLVTVARGRRLSEDVSWCAFRSDLL